MLFDQLVVRTDLGNSAFVQNDQTGGVAERGKTVRDGDCRAVLMSTWVKVGFQNAASIFSTADAVTAATPLANMHQGLMCEESLMDLFIGNVGGCIGETSAAALLIGFV